MRKGKLSKVHFSLLSPPVGGVNCKLLGIKPNETLGVYLYGRAQRYGMGRVNMIAILRGKKRVKVLLISSFVGQPGTIKTVTTWLQWL